MQRREAHVPLYFFPENPENNANGVVVNQQNILYLYTVYHALHFKYLDSLFHAHMPLGQMDTLYAQFGEKKEPVHFQRKIRSEDIAHAKIANTYGPGLYIEGKAEKGDRLYLIGYHHNRLFSTEVTVIGDYFDGQIEILPIDKGAYFAYGMSGSALVRDPNKKNLAVAILTEMAIDTSKQRSRNRIGVAELLDFNAKKA